MGVEEKKYKAIINIRGVLVDIICKISSDYKAYATRYKVEIKQLLLHYQSALYGTMLASLICDCNFNKSLTSIGFEINLYDTCVTNKAIDRSQMPI